MAALSDKQVLETYREAGFNMAEAARRLGCGYGRVAGAIRRRDVEVRAEREDLLFQERKFRLRSELSRLEIVR